MSPPEGAVVVEDDERVANGSRGNDKGEENENKEPATMFRWLFSSKANQEGEERGPQEDVERVPSPLKSRWRKKRLWRKLLKRLLKRL